MNKLLSSNKKYRQELKAKGDPYWEYIRDGLWLGIYKGERKTSWKVRKKKPNEKRYFKKTMGEADCVEGANGVSVLSFDQALSKAIEWGNSVTPHIPRSYLSK